MVTANSVDNARRRLLQTLFRQGVPRLWCPTLTHFQSPGVLDRQRLSRHLCHIAPWVKGILVPGSTGEGWEMQDAQIRDLLSIVIENAQSSNTRILIGVLKTDVDQVLECLQGIVEWLKQRTGRQATDDALADSMVVGFTVCPPRGADLDQRTIESALARVLASGLPIALYQLPQVTQNEMAPETAARLARSFANFFMFKDTSARDQVALSDQALGGVFLVRGAEGEYARWPKTAGGPYDGFLLSTANVFAEQLATVLSLWDQGRGTEAERLSAQVDSAVKRSFGSVESLEFGNPFTNANKAMDHVMAYGKAAVQIEPPLLFKGMRLPTDVIREIASVLQVCGLFPQKGYLE